jgi:hypothetical protein
MHSPPPHPPHHTAAPICADRYGEIRTEEAAVFAWHHLEYTIIQSASTFHVRRVSASAPNLHSLPSPPHHTAAPICADRYGEIRTEEAAVSASRHLKHAIMQRSPTFHVRRVSVPGQQPPPPQMHQQPKLALAIERPGNSSGCMKEFYTCTHSCGYRLQYAPKGMSLR